MPSARADRRGGLGRGGRRRRRAGRAARSALVAPAAGAGRRRRVRMFSGGRWHDAALVERERRCARATRSTARRSSPRSNATTVVEPGWRARVTGARPPGARARRRRARRGAPIGTTRRSGAARGVQQPVHEHRRADGPAAAEHRVLGQHQGAARLLVRAVRRRRQPDRQRAAHAGAPGLDERVDQDGDRAQRRPDAAAATSSCSTIRTTAARTCPTSPWSRRSSTTTARDDPVLRRLARPPRRHRRHHAGLDAAVLDPHRGGGRADRQRQAGRARPLPRGRDARAAARAASTRRATRRRTSPT